MLTAPILSYLLWQYLAKALQIENIQENYQVNALLVISPSRSVKYTIFCLNIILLLRQPIIADKRSEPSCIWFSLCTHNIIQNNELITRSHNIMMIAIYVQLLFLLLFFFHSPFIFIYILYLEQLIFADALVTYKHTFIRNSCPKYFR